MTNWKSRYPESIRKDSKGEIIPWPLFGYRSEMVNMALATDDAEGFVGWMKECGLDKSAKTFDGLTMEQYCKKRGAKKCLQALKNL